MGKIKGALGGKKIIIARTAMHSTLMMVGGGMVWGRQGVQDGRFCGANQSCYQPHEAFRTLGESKRGSTGPQHGFADFFLC